MATLERFGPSGHDLVMLDDARSTLSLGKNPDNDLVIDDDSAVSRVHARLERLGPAWCITDLGSTNGTRVNGERLAGPQTLFDRDEIYVGRTRLVLRDPGSRADVTTEPLRPPPPRTAGEQRVLIELCRPLITNRQTFTSPASVRSIAEALYVGIPAVRQHLGHLYDKFGIYAEGDDSRRVRLANEAIQSGAVTHRDYPAKPESP